MPSIATGRHFFADSPDRPNCPLPVLEAIARPTIDHRGPEFKRLAGTVLEGIRPIFGTCEPVIIFPASGTGAWEAALVNTLSPGDHVLMFETGWFASLWRKLAERLGLKAEILPGDWRGGRRCGGDRGAAARGSRPCDQGGLRGA